MKETIDYSKKENWYQIPEITKDVDTFYIYATEYIMGSLMEGAPEYASLDNEEMLQGAAGEYLLHATAYADATNVFMPYYRQCGMTVMKRAWKETGNVEIQDIGADAQVLPDRGVVVTHAKGMEMDEETIKVVGEFFGPDGRHGEDYALFYNNIKDNVAKRIAAYKANHLR